MLTMEQTLTTGLKVKKILRRFERELIDAELNGRYMQDILDNYIRELISMYYELNQYAEESDKSFHHRKQAKRILLATRKLKNIIEKILLSEKLTNTDIFKWLFKKNLDLKILLEFEKIFEYEELPF